MDNNDDPALLQSQKNLQDKSYLKTTVIGAPAGQAEDLEKLIAMEPEDESLEALSAKKSSKWKMFFQKKNVNKKVGRCLFYL
jgi:hypothetical protein